MGMNLLSLGMKFNRPSLSVTEELRGVVRRVRSVLRCGDRVFRVSRRFESCRRHRSVQKYSEEVLDIRVSRSGVLLQVLLPCSSRWSSVWSSEELLSDSGEILFVSPDFEELESMLSGSYFSDLMDDFMEEFDVFPLERSKVA